MKISSLGSMIIVQFVIVKIAKGQCQSNDTCLCHCVDCTKACTECSRGWSGSVKNKCQRVNTLYQAYGEIDTQSPILDDDLQTSKEDSSEFPFVRVQLKNLTQIEEVEVTLLLRRNTNYTFYVKKMEFVREPAVICDTLVFTEADTKRTLSMKCSKPLTGKYLEIASTGNSELQVFEIQSFDCTRGTFGENCSNVCPPGCDQECDKMSGDCACQKGLYGKSCSDLCSPFCDENDCNSSSGDCFGCKNGHFGNRCEKNCSIGCQDNCDKTSGYCICKSGFYSANCSMECSPMCYNKYCEQMTGICSSCDDGYYGKYCNERCLEQCIGSCDKSFGICEKCSRNRFGRFCNFTCPMNCKGDTCVRDDGDCKECKPGYKGNKCSEPCPKNCQQCNKTEFTCNVCEQGYYGLTCSEECPVSCGGNKSCKIKSGDCYTCSTGYYGNKCEEKCNENCDLKRQCNKDTGQCVKCIVGKHGLFCTEFCSENCINLTCLNNKTCAFGCKDEWFGEKCNQKCSAAIRSCTHCIQRGDTEKVECLKCADTWFLNGSMCYKCPENCSSCESIDMCTKCKNNHSYGERCQYQCNNACINNTCKRNGNCLNGCSNGKYGSECDQNCPKGCRLCFNASKCLECDDGYYDAICQLRCQDNCKVCHDNVSCDACTIGWTNQSKTCKTNKLGCSDVSLICAFCDHGFYGNQCKKKCEHCINATCDDEGKCGIACKPNTNAKQCAALKDSDGTDPSPEFIIIATVLLLITLMTAVIVILYLKIRRKVRRVKPQEDQLTVHLRNGLVAENNELSLYNIRGSQALLTELDPEEDIEEIPVPVIENHNYLNVKISRIFVNSLWEFTLKNKANDCLKEEFRGLPEGLLLECRVAKKTGNKKLNRYKHIYPYDTTRFVLNFENGNKAGDYINASYVNGLEKPREYIAAQGPFTDDTINDFWRMIWQSNANTIIILTNLEENDIMKCKKYWPKSEIAYGDFQIKMETEESSPLFTVRRFNVNKEGEERTIEQFHFTAWPDKGVPRDVNSILEFRNRVICKTDISGPLLVHCSAGIGRTGSFIAIDYLIKQGQRDGSVDVVSCVSRLRHQRAHAIQTVEQYIYLYDVITKELTGRQSALLKDEFRNYLSQLKSVNPGTGKQHIEEEFQLIEKLTPTFDEKRYESAKAVNNLSKNRHNNVLPDDSYRLYLSRGESDYINAVQLPDAQRPFGYILTQTPLPNTVGDFLSLVADQEVLSIVMFDHDQEENVGVYLPSKEGPILCDSFELFLLDQSELGDIDVLNLKFYDIQVQDARFINVFRCHFWKQNRLVPEHHQPMIDLIEAVLNVRKEHSGHPVLVHCMNGAKQSGMFCVLANLVEQIQLFGSVDILQTVVYMRHRRIQIVPCLAQLEYIYDFIENYLKTTGENSINV